MWEASRGEGIDARAHRVVHGTLDWQAQEGASEGGAVAEETDGKNGFDSEASLR